MTPDFKALCADISQEFPRFELVRKRGSWAMRLFGLVLGERFLTTYVSTIGSRVYVPDEFDGWTEASRCVVLRHERVHMRQSRRLTFLLFTLLYALVPLPLGLAYCRARFEMEAYAESLQAFKDYDMDYSSDHRREWFLRQFTTGMYVWMWPFKGVLNRWFDEAVAGLK